MIKFEKSTKRKILTEITKPISYDIKKYGFSEGTGKNVKMSILDTGCPAHRDILIKSEVVSFCENPTAVNDKIGHATMVAGIIGANNKKSIVGIAPDSEIIYGKIFDDSGASSFNSLVAGVLWSIVKNVDIIVLAIKSQYDYGVLKDAIKKARERGICIISAAGKNDKEIDFPARYDGVISAGALTSNKEKNKMLKTKIDLYIPNKSIMTTYVSNQYIEMGGSSISTAFFAGLASLLIEKYKRDNVKKTEIPSLVFNTLTKSII